MSACGRVATVKAMPIPSMKDGPRKAEAQRMQLFNNYPFVGWGCPDVAPGVGYSNLLGFTDSISL